MLDPKFIFSEDILTAKLAALPIDSFFVSASVSTDVLIALLKLERHTAFSALGEYVCVFALS